MKLLSALFKQIEKIMNLIGAGIETPKAKQEAPSSGKILQFLFFLFFCTPLHACMKDHSFFSWLIRSDILCQELLEL